jgi:hypothetical protein
VSTGPELGHSSAQVSCQSGLRRALSRQNSLPSGSARTCQDSSPVWPMSAGRAPSLRRRSSSASCSRSVALTSMCSRDFPGSGSSLRLRMMVGCGRRTLRAARSRRRPLHDRHYEVRTSHQNRAAPQDRQPSTSSLIRHAIDETCSQRGNCRSYARSSFRLLAVGTRSGPLSGEARGAKAGEVRLVGRPAGGTVDRASAGFSASELRSAGQRPRYRGARIVANSGHRTAGERACRLEDPAPASASAAGKIEALIRRPERSP